MARARTTQPTATLDPEMDPTEEIRDDPDTTPTPAPASGANGSAPLNLPGIRPAFRNGADDLDKLDKVLARDDVSGGIVKIHRRGPTASRFSYVQEVPVEEFNMDWVKSVHGGGSYLFKLYSRDKRLYEEFSFEIDPRIRGTMDAPSPVPAVIPPGNDKAGNEMLALVMQMQQQNTQLLVTVMAESQKTMAGVMAAAFGGRASQQASEPVSALLTAATGLIGNRRQEPTPMEQMASMLTLLRELKGMTGGDSNAGPADEKETTGDKLLGMLAQSVPGVLQLIASRNQPQQPSMPQGPRVVNPQPQAIPQAPVPVPSPNPQPATATPVPVPDDGSAQAFFANLPDSGKMLIGQLRQVYPLLRSGAASNTPVESYLDILEDAIDDEAAELLEKVMARPDWKLILFGEPDPQPAAWFDNLREAYLLPPDSEPVATVNAPAPLAVVP